MSPLTSRLAQVDRRLIALVGTALVVLLLVATVGGVYVYQQSVPTTVSLNLKAGQTEVPLDQPLTLHFSRSVPETVVATHLKVNPVVDGHLTTTPDHRSYTYTGSAPYADLTRYTVTVAPFASPDGHRVQPASWTFTTTIVPRIIALATPEGSGVAADAEIPIGTPLRVTFNTAMDTGSVQLQANGQPLTLAWAPDGRSATLDTKALKIGPLALTALAGKDLLGHALLTTWKLTANLVFRVNVHTTPLKYPALVQIPNDLTARDQSGLQSADMVFEYATEGNIPRFTALFTNIPDKVGPVRSGRLISIKLTQHYRGELFLSGTSQGTFQVLRNSGIYALFDTVGYFYRSADRPAPNNLYTSGEAVARSESQGGPGPSQLNTGRLTLPANSEGMQVSVPYNGHGYRFDAATGTYMKDEDGHTFADASVGQPLHIALVAVVHSRVTATGIVEDSNGAHGLDYDLDSGGALELYYRGQKATGRWSSPDPHSPLVFTLDGGQQVTLPPGLVWVEVVP